MRPIIPGSPEWLEAQKKAKVRDSPAFENIGREERLGFGDLTYNPFSEQFWDDRFGDWDYGYWKNLNPADRKAMANDVLSSIAGEEVNIDDLTEEKLQDILNKAEEKEKEDGKEGTVAGPTTVRVTGEGDPEDPCEELADKVREALYKNKRGNPSEGEFGTGYHGLANRIVEQMCGANGPGSDPWETHQDEIRGSADKTNKAKEAFKDAGCDEKEHFSRNERKLINMAKVGDKPGALINKKLSHQPSHAICQGLNLDQSGRIMDTIMRMLGG